MFRHFLIGFAVTIAMSTEGSPVSAQRNGQDIDFVERYALAEDRQAVLKELVPGTEPYYFFHCLHYQNTGQLDRSAEMMRTWEKRLGNGGRYREMKHRQSLLMYSDKPEATLAYLKSQMNLNFNHQRRRPTAEPGLATELDQSLISLERLNQRALGRRNLDRYEDLALPFAATQKLSNEQLRYLLRRLNHPAVESLPALIHRDLQNRGAKPFGSYPVHNLLTRTQLDELVKLRPALGNQSSFVNNYMQRLAPSDDVNLQSNRAEMQAYLQRLEDFVMPLSSVHNSLKASILYRRLYLDRTLGVYDQDRFMKYIQLPRQLYYVDPDFVKASRKNNHFVDMNANYSGATRLRPINDDEQLVRDYLHYFLTDSRDTQAYDKWIEDRYLRERFAEAKLTAGLGDNEKWASMLSPAKFKELMERIDLEFAFTNPTEFNVDDAVEIKLTTKNVKNLIVKVFEINTANFYRNNNRDINTDIVLDGLVPNWQKTYDYEDDPIRRVERTFKFDEINRRGVFIVDFIGNGKSSRALIRKGKLTHLVETTVEGQRFIVLDENNELVKDAKLWISGREFKPQENGSFLVPFSTKPGNETLIIEYEGLSVRNSFIHAGESYNLNAGIYVDRESLIRNRTAKVIVRPQLKIAGQPAPVGLLENVSLVVRATDLDGIESTKEFDDLKLNEKFETDVEIMVPSRIRTVNFELRATVMQVTTQTPRRLTASHAVSVNGIDTTDKLQAVHLRQNDNGYMLAVRGKTGEARKAQAVRLHLKHRWFQEPVRVNLQSDINGQIKLGELKDIHWIKAELVGVPEQSWTLRINNQTQYTTMHALEGEPVRFVPDSHASGDYRLFETRGGKFVVDVSDKIKIADGLGVLDGLDAGDYQLLNQFNGTRFNVKVTKGKNQTGFAMGESRNLELRGTNPLYVKKFSTDGEKVKIQLDGDLRFARVHVIASRYQPRFNVFSQLSKVGDIEPLQIGLGYDPSVYIAGRTIGEEYQYILNRQFHEKFPGNMLTRPSLLLNPWELRTTNNDVQVAAAGDDFGLVDAKQNAARKRAPARQQGQSTDIDFASLDYLAEGSIVIPNLAADENGLIEIDRDLFEDKHMVRIVVQNHSQTMVRSGLLPESQLEFRDLRLAESLDPDKHFAQQKQYTVIKKDQTFELDEASSARLQQYDNLADVYRYYVTLTNNSNLVKFGFLMDWPNKTEKEKFDLYKRYACHEFNFFLMHKDPDYFADVIVPYLSNKMHKTFLDEYLLQMELKSWVKPWEFKRLNTLEQIILGRRQNDHRQQLIHHVNDDYDNHPTSRRAFGRYFDFAVANEQLDRDANFASPRDGLRMLEDKKLDDQAGGEAAPRPSAGLAMGRPGNSVRGGGAGGRRGEKSELGTPMMDAEEEARNRYKDTTRGRRRGLMRADSAKKLKSQPNESATEEMDEIEGLVMDRFEPNQESSKRSLKERRKSLRQYYQRIKPTQEWVENNYYRLPIESQTSELVRVNRFWRDYAMHNDEEPFLSPYFAESSRNFTEMMLALAVLDLPFEKPEHEMEMVENQLKLVPQNDLIAFYQQVRPVVFDRGESSILISENFFRADDRYRTVDGKRREKFVRKEFISNVLYGGQVVITNPTSTPREIDLLVQIPQGAMPASSSKTTRTQQMDLAPFSTQTMEFYFYFPAVGDFDHYPAHVSSEAEVLAVADAQRFNVVEQPTEIDTESWAYISQNGTEQQVLDYLQRENLQSTSLDLIAFRMKNKEFYAKAIELLANRFGYNHTLWAYAVNHNDVPQIRQFLKHDNNFVNRCGPYFASELLDIEPVIRFSYQHKEYWPLVNARSHQLGGNRKILNNAIWQQYHQLLNIIARQSNPSDEAHLATAYYMLLQDRVAEAIAHFEKVDVEKLATQLQYDYCAAYIAMYESDPQRASQIAEKYADYPVKRWQELFAAVVSQVAEINGDAPEVVDATDSAQRQAEAASQTPNFEFIVESLKTKVNFQNLDKLTVNYYLMDVELLFSRNPFVQRQDDSFAMIMPNRTETIELPKEKKLIEFALPEEFHTSNVLVEISGGGKTRRQAYYANSMNVEMIEQYGQIKVVEAETSKLLPKTYVKVYARKANGSVQFYKDGYTDLRGRFDYASLSNQDLNDVNRFAILVISPKHGAIVREAGLPKE